MEHAALQKNIKALQTLYPNIEGMDHRLSLEDMQGLPAWVQGAIDLYKLPLFGKPLAPLYLLLPKTELEFEHLIRIYKQLFEKLHAHVLIIADPLPPKHRPLLVKFQIPFIYKDETIFAPNLGLKIFNLNTLHDEPKLELKIKKDELTPFALKIFAGVLTNQITKEFTLMSLHEQMQMKGVKIALGKLSAALNELAAHELLSTHPDWRTKTYIKKSAADLLEKFMRLKLAPFFREVQTNYVPKDKGTYVVAGETALAHYSNLASPKQTTIAMTSKNFRAVYQNSKTTIPYGDFGNRSVVQVWKEDPRLFSIDGLINPVELFFSMKNHHDERVQMSLEEMLAPYDLTRR